MTTIAWERIQLTDADLLRGAQCGDSDAWKALYERYLPSVWRQACALIDDAHVAEDVTSETMLALLRGIRELDADVPSLGAWLRTVVHRKAMDHHRQAYRRRAKFPASGDAAEECAARESRQPLEIAETCARVQIVLEEISERQRIVLQWKYVDNLGVREMAERLGETEKAVESVLYRARREFRRIYELQRVGPAASPPIPLPAAEPHSQGAP